MKPKNAAVIAPVGAGVVVPNSSAVPGSVVSA